MLSSSGLCPDFKVNHPHPTRVRTGLVLANLAHSSHRSQNLASALEAIPTLSDKLDLSPKGLSAPSVRTGYAPALRHPTLVHSGLLHSRPTLQTAAATHWTLPTVSDAFLLPSFRRSEEAPLWWIALSTWK